MRISKREDAYTCGSIGDILPEGGGFSAVLGGTPPSHRSLKKIRNFS